MTHARKLLTAEWLTAAVAVAALLASIYGAYLSNDRASAIATATIQAHEEDVSQRMDRMENKLDTLIYYITGIRPGPEPLPKVCCDAPR